MWLIQLALRRPYTFIVLALLLAVLGPLTILRTPTDIFPNINIPVLSIVWSYNGFSAQDMTNRITTPVERALTSDVDNIAHIESQTVNGIAVIKVYFHPGSDINRAIAEASANSQSILRILPPGALPPLIISYNASTVPILQLALSSKTLSEQELYDLGNSFIRTQLATVQGASVPLPFGGKVRQVMVDLDPQALQAKGLAPLDVINAVNAQNLILPGGTAKIGALEYNVNMNGSTDSIAALNDLPLKATPGGMIYLHDVATVHDGFAPQTNIVRVNGKRAALLQVEKSGTTSTLSIIAQVKALLPSIAAGLPKALQIKPVSDQSVFVSSAIAGVVREGVIAAALTGLMILLFLGSWRSTLIIAVTIPLSVLTSLIVLSVLGETINVMTLGGLALAVGILVDDATVAIENISHHRDNGKPLMDAIVDASAEIALPTLVSTLSICIVFLPMFLLPGVARYLFVPLAEAVVFAMLASYFFSRTLIPTLAMYLLRDENIEAAERSSNAFARLQQRFERGFQWVSTRYATFLEGVVARPKAIAGALGLLFISAMILLPVLGRDFFPTSDTGEIRLHMRARTGTRIEQTASLVDQVETDVRHIVPAKQLSSIMDNIGLPVSGINMTYDSSSPVGSADADVMVELAPDHRPTAQYVSLLRDRLNHDFPGISFSFLPADIISQILDFGLPAPIDVQIVGNDEAGNRAVAQELLKSLRNVPGLMDPRIQQPDDAPAINVDVDRTKALQAGFEQRAIAQNLLIALSGSSQTSPNFWLNPHNGVSYPLITQSPQYRIDSLQALANIPLSSGNDKGVTHAALNTAPILGSLSTFQRGNQDALISHYNVQPVIDIFADVQGRDLGSVASDVAKRVADVSKSLPAGSKIAMHGEVATMQSAFHGLIVGLIFAICLVYALMVVNFQSWVDPFIIITGLPGALAGVAWMLFVTDTTVSVPALTGAIMCIGIAASNSILVVTFGREQLEEGASIAEAAINAGKSRFRPVVMTALAMLIGMLPMALGLGDGGEQNAPLGRAVIGGLLFGTATTLLFVPASFAAVHGWIARRVRKAQPGLPAISTQS